MKRYIAQFKQGWNISRWQWYFLALFLPLCFMILTISGYNGRTAPHGLTAFSFFVAGVVSFIWAGSVVGNESQITKPTLLMLVAWVLLVIYVKTTLRPNQDHQVRFRFGEGYFCIKLTIDPVTHIRSIDLPSMNSYYANPT